MSTIGQVHIDLDAGTSKFVLQMQEAKAKLHEFGEAGVSEHKAVAAAVKALEGNVFNSTRAADAFIAKFSGLGPLLTAVFPVVGALAFAGVLGEVGKKVYDFFKELREAPEKAAGAFRTLSLSIHTSNDELALANVRLENDIAKLEGKRQNGLALMLAEARVEADKLGNSIEKDFESFQKLLKAQETSFLGRLFSGDSDNKEEQKYFGGESGFGGIRGQFQQLQQRENAALATATTQEAIKQISDEFNQQRRILLADAKEFEQHQLQPTLEHTPERRGGLPTAGTGESQDVFVAKSSADLEKTKANIAVLDEMSQHYALLETNVVLVAKKAGAEVGKANQDAIKSIDELIKKLQAQAAGKKALLEGVGGTEADQVQAKATQEYDKVLAELINKLGVYKNAITALDKVKIKSAITQDAQTDADIKSKAGLNEVIKGLQERITAQKELAQAIGATYEISRQAAVQTEIGKVTKDHVGDPAWLAAHAQEIKAAGEKGGELHDATAGTDTAKTLFGLNKQIELEQELATVQSQGAEAVRRAELAQKIQVIQRTNSADAAQKLVAAEIALYNAQRNNAAQANITKFGQEADAQSKLGSAAFGGADAVRRQQLINQYNEAARAGASSTELSAQASRDWEEHQRQISTEAAQMVTHFSDQLEKLDNMKVVLEAQKKSEGDNLEINIALRNLENERLHVLAEQTLQIGTAQAGLKAFFLEAQSSAKQTSNIVYEALNSALDKISDQFANLFSGKKTSFAKTFQDLGGEVEKSTLKTGLQKGLGFLGSKIFGDKNNPLAGKADGSSASKALWVRMAGGLAKDGGSDLGILAKLGQNAPGSTNTGTGDYGGEVTGDDAGDTASKLGGLFGSGAKGLSGIFSLIPKLFPMMADGGDVNPFSTYIVGEHAPEFFTPRSAGTITPLSKAAGGSSHSYTIDARGADLGAGQRVARAIDMAHSSAIQNGVKASHERSLRTPQRSR